MNYQKDETTEEILTVGIWTFGFSWLPNSAMIVSHSCWERQRPNKLFIDTLVVSIFMLQAN